MHINGHETHRRYVRFSIFIAFALAGAAMIAPGQSAVAAAPAQVAQVSLGDAFNKGMASMRARNYRDALGYFRSATDSKPDDSRPWMMLGMTLNRLGDFPAALAALDKSALLGMKSPRLDFETGWAALNAGSPQRAVDRLTAYEKAKPGGAKTSEFLGRAYLRLGKPDEAEKSLNEALRRDPGLGPTVQLYLTRIALARGEDRKAVSGLFGMLKDFPTSPVSQSIRNSVLRPLAQRRLARQRQAAKSWNAYVSSTAGYNDNVIGYSSELNLPAEISPRDSAFLTMEAGAQYVHRIGDDHALTGGYGGRYDNFFDIGNKDVLDNSVYARYAYAVRQIPGDVVASLQGSYGHTRIGGSRFRDSLGFRPGVSFRPADNFSMELFYRRTIGVIHASPTGNEGVTDRDGTLSVVGARAVVAVPDTDLTVSVGAARLHNNADGTDHSYRGNQFSVGARLKLFDAYTVNGEVAKTYYNYTSAHSLAPDPATGAGFFFARRDNITTVNLRVSRLVTEGVDVFAKFDYTRAQSNLLLFSYFQNVFGAGVIARF